ncbi:MAG: hypothetical protein GX580_02835 [Candidatus Hydrogenedens sp.]|nr:hypothetical protein [Candidatus Hydrogenedentota bacterium]NLF56554.1 hypothetical protein [Candidatus Hydrogenedens sp.]
MTQTERFTGIVKKAGYKSLGQWAAQNGYARTTVYQTIYVWGERDTERPLGGLARQVMGALRALESEQGRQG